MAKRKPRRLFSDLDDVEIESLEDHIENWLSRNNVAGSVAGHYSLYEALYHVRDQARLEAVEPAKIFITWTDKGIH